MDILDPQTTDEAQSGQRDTDPPHPIRINILRLLQCLWYEFTLPLQLSLLNPSSGSGGKRVQRGRGQHLRRTEFQVHGIHRGAIVFVEV